MYPGTPSYHPYFRLGFSLINHPAMGVPGSMEPPNRCILYIYDNLNVFIEFWRSRGPGPKHKNVSVNLHPPWFLGGVDLYGARG